MILTTSIKLDTLKSRCVTRLEEILPIGREFDGGDEMTNSVEGIFDGRYRKQPREIGTYNSLRVTKFPRLLWYFWVKVRERFPMRRAGLVDEVEPLERKKY